MLWCPAALVQRNGTDNPEAPSTDYPVGALGMLLGLVLAMFGCSDTPSSLAPTGPLAPTATHPGGAGMSAGGAMGSPSNGIGADGQGPTSPMQPIASSTQGSGGAPDAALPAQPSDAGVGDEPDAAIGMFDAAAVVPDAHAPNDGGEDDAGSETPATPACKDLHPPEVVEAWVLDVLSGTEFGGGGVRFAAWASPPSVSLIQGDSVERGLLQAAIEDVNSALEGVATVALIADGEENSDIVAYFLPLSEFESVGQQWGFPITPGNLGLWWTFWDGSLAKTKGIGLIANDRLSGERLEHFVIEELIGALGFSNDSPRFEESVIYEDTSIGQFGSATRLSACDRQLIRFVYESLDAGLTPDEIRNRYRLSWPM